MAIPEVCKSCVHRFRDELEGHACTKVEKSIELSDGSVLTWPGYAVKNAIDDCRGALAKPSVLGRLRYLIGL